MGIDRTPSFPLWLVCGVLLAALLLSGCAGSGTARKAGGRGSGAIGDNSHLPLGKPYTVRGKTYRPYTAAHGFTEEGVASWYGPGFHGKTTSNGERYDQHAMTAAHKLLPFDTRIRVTNMGNGKSVVVRINDRGPFVHERIIDLSHQAASRIGMLQSGTARVRLESLDGDKRPVSTPDSGVQGRFYVQVGAFGLRANANRALRDARGHGLSGRIQRNRDTGVSFVQIGPFPSASRAETAVQTLRPQFPEAFVIAE